jgi:lipopolysaccharide/colanic/teichoic acid biosynthesis glycosyltransferase
LKVLFTKSWYLFFGESTSDAEIHKGAQWTTANDPRVTRIGGLLRRDRIEGLPQLVNILRGDMSFVVRRQLLFPAGDNYSSLSTTITLFP